MSVQETKAITCMRCGTLVPWAPHCPHCGAYLEFTGNPPWMPDAPESSAVVDEQVDSPADGATPAEAGQPEKAESPETGEWTDYEELFVPIDTPLEPSTDATLEDATAASMSLAARFSRATQRYPDRKWAGYLVVVGLSLIVYLILALFFGATAIWALPLFLLWGVFIVGFFATRKDRDESLLVEEADAEEELEATSVEVAVETSPVDDDEFAAHAPQTVLPAMQRSRPLSVGSKAVRDVPCADCGRMNIAGHRFCDRCGAILADAVVAPPVIAVSTIDREEEAREARRRYRRVSGSWRNPIIYLSLGLAFVTALVFAFLGPGAFQTRIGLTAVFQVISQFIDPYAGSPARVETVTASSTLPGTDASQAGMSDTRTFWASSPTVGFGAGANLRFDFDAPVEINRLVIYPGIQNQQFDLRAVATPEQITLTFDDGSSFQATLQPLDTSSDRRQLVEFPDNTTGSVTLAIDSVYPPRGATADGFGEVAISGVEFLQTPKPPAVFQVQRGGIRAPAIPGAPAP